MLAHASKSLRVSRDVNGPDSAHAYMGPDPGSITMQDQNASLSPKWTLKPGSSLLVKGWKG